MLSIMPSTNGHNDWNKKVKKEGGTYGLNFNGKGFATPLYIDIHLKKKNCNKIWLVLHWFESKVD
jgi:hypothetical protein